MPGPNGEECGLCKAFAPIDPLEVTGHCKAKGSGIKLCEARALEMVPAIAPTLDAACNSPLPWYHPSVFFFDWCLPREDGGEFVAADVAPPPPPPPP